MNVSFALVSCAWLVGASASRVPICVPPTQRKGVRPGMAIVRFAYVLWYLQGMEDKEEEEELFI